MVKRVVVGAVVLFTVLALKGVSAQSKPTQYVTSAEAVKFTPLDPKDPDGAAVSVVSGELQGKGPITLFLRLAKGVAPMHTHTASYQAVLVKGQAKHWPAGTEAKAQTLNPGSHWYQPGKALHGDECLASQCVLFLQFDGPYDFVPVTK
jgi:hypothetical protein